MTTTVPAENNQDDQSPTVRVSGPAPLLALVPYLLGFQPADSVVVVGTSPPSGQVKLTLRYDLPVPPDTEISAEIARHVTEVLSAQELRTAAVIGYGPAGAVTPVTDALASRAVFTGLEITEMLRVQGQRYWSYVCSNPACCDPEGTPYSLDDPAVEAMAATRRPVYDSREHLAATIASVTGADAETMADATSEAVMNCAALVGEGGAAGRKRLGSAGVEAVTEAVEIYRRGESIPAGQSAAWLTVVLRDLRVRDDAWCRMDPQHRTEHQRLWTDITRFARPGYVAAPASLLAFTAWQCGNGALANVALDRALNDNPRYRMAQLLRQAIDAGCPPSLAQIPMTPEEVEASYEEAWDDDEPEDDGEDEEEDDWDEDELD